MGSAAPEAQFRFSPKSWMCTFTVGRSIFKVGMGMCRQSHSSGLGRGEAQLLTSASLTAQHHGWGRKGTAGLMCTKSGPSLPTGKSCTHRCRAVPTLNRSPGKPLVLFSSSNQKQLLVFRDGMSPAKDSGQDPLMN